MRSQIEGFLPAGVEVSKWLGLDVRSPEEELQAAIVEAVKAEGESRSQLVGGFSLGARLLISVAERLSRVGFLCVGYPFHDHGAPKSTRGLDALRAFSASALIIQGERDAHGSKQDVRSYQPLPSRVHLHWVRDGNHRLEQRARSKVSPVSWQQDAAEAVRIFCANPRAYEGEQKSS